MIEATTAHREPTPAAPAALPLVAGPALTERDQRILKLIWRLGLATTSQIRRVVFADAGQTAQLTSAKRRLRFLTDTHFLDRLPRPKQQEAAYTLGPQGRLWLQPQAQADIKPLTLANEAALTHALGLTEFVTRLILASQDAGLHLQWIRQFTLTHTDGTVFEPDGTGRLSRADDQTWPFFVEWHQGQETTQAITARLQRYLSLKDQPTAWQPLRPQDRRFPPLLFITPGGLMSLHAAVTALPPTADLAVWWAAWPDLDQEGALSPAFYRVGATGFTGPTSLLHVLGAA